MAENVYVVCAIDTEGPIDDPDKPEILSNWGRVDDLICKITSEKYRLSYPDSYGGGLIFSWFILHLTGFKTNPFNRLWAIILFMIIIFQFMEKLLKNMVMVFIGIIISQPQVV